MTAKYGRVTTERKEIPESEPVFLLRAQDRLAPLTIAQYRQLCAEHGASRAHLDEIEDLMHQFEDWQARNPTKMPD